MARRPAVRFTSKVDKAGRVVIPAELRNKLGIEAGGTVTMKPGPSGRIVLEPTSSVLREAQEYFQSIAPADVLWSDELIAERRREARREVED